MLLRAFPGAVLFDAALYKITFEGSSSFADTVERFRVHDFRPLVEAAIADPPRLFGHPFTAYATFLNDVLLGSPGWERFVCGGLLAFELLAGAALVLGFSRRLVAVLASLLRAAVGLSRAAWILTPNHANWLLVAMLLAASFLATGRVAGIDRRLAGRWPRWIS